REGGRGIFYQRADERGTAERLTKPADGNRQVPQAWSPKCDVLVFSERSGDRTTLHTFTLADKKITQFGGVEGQAIGPDTASFSRDGRWVAYSVLDKGPQRVYVQPSPAPVGCCAPRSPVPRPPRTHVYGHVQARSQAPARILPANLFLCLRGGVVIARW